MISILLAVMLSMPAKIGPLPAEPERVIDADTVQAIVLIWLDTTVLARVRIINVDTPEMSAKSNCEREAAEKATAFTEEWLSQGRVSLIVFKHDKYGGRVDGDFIRDGEFLSQALVASGHARPYFGGKKQVWCHD